MCHRSHFVPDACRGRRKIYIFVGAVLVVSGCNDTQLNDFFSTTVPQPLKVTGTFGQLNGDLITGTLDHFVTLEVDPFDLAIRSPSTGCAKFVTDIDGIPNCIVLKPKARFSGTSTEGLDKSLPNFKDLRVVIGNLDNGTALRDDIIDLQINSAGESTADAPTKADEFLAVSLTTKEEDWPYLDVYAEPEVSGLIPKHWSRFGIASGSVLKITAYKWDDIDNDDVDENGERTFVNPLPYLSKIPGLEARIERQPPVVDFFVVENSLSPADFSSSTPFVMDMTSDASAGVVSDFIRFQFSLDEFDASNPSGPTTIPYEISYELEHIDRTGGVITPLETISRGVFHCNSLSPADSTSVRDDLYATPTDTSMPDIWMHVPVDTTTTAPTDPAAANVLTNGVDYVFDLTAMGPAGRVFTPGDYRITLTLRDVLSPDLPAVEVTGHFVVAGTGLKVELVADAGNDNSIDLTDPAIDHVQVGHWGADSGTGVDGYAAGALLNGGTPATSFINKDPERFFVRVQDDAANTDPATAETVTAQIGTRAAPPNPGIGAIDDDLTSVTLTESGPDTGVFVSQAQLLQSIDLPPEPFTDTDGNGLHDGGEPFTDLNLNGAHDTFNPDDDHPVHDGFAGTVRDDAANDRTHRAEVDGSVIVEYGASAGSALSLEIPVCQRTPTDERRVLHVHVFIFNEPWQDTGFDDDGNPATPVVGAGDGLFSFTDTDGNGQHDAGEASETFIDISTGAAAFGGAGSRGQIWTDDQVTLFVEYLKAYLASSRIRVEVDGQTVPDPTGNLFNQPGVGPAAGTAGFFDDFGDDVTGATPSRDEAIIQASFRSAVNLNASDADDIIDIYFVAPFTAAGGAFASQFRPGFANGAGLASTVINQVHVGLNAVLSPAGNVPVVLAHELMHQLTNQPDSPTAAEVFAPSTSFAPNDSTTVLRRRRMQEATAVAARTTRPAGSMAAIGNRVLRNP